MGTLLDLVDFEQVRAGAQKRKAGQQKAGHYSSCSYSLPPRGITYGFVFCCLPKDLVLVPQGTHHGGPVPGITHGGGPFPWFSHGGGSGGSTSGGGGTVSV